MIGLFPFTNSIIGFLDKFKNHDEDDDNEITPDSKDLFD